MALWDGLPQELQRNVLYQIELLDIPTYNAARLCSKTFARYLKWMELAHSRRPASVVKGIMIFLRRNIQLRQPPMAYSYSRLYNCVFLTISPQAPQSTPTIQHVCPSGHPFSTSPFSWTANRVSPSQKSAVWMAISLLDAASALLAFFEAGMATEGEEVALPMTNSESTLFRAHVDAILLASKSRLR